MQFNVDSTGHVALAYEVEGKLVKAANAPVFGLYDFNLTNGGIGGSVISVRSLGSRTAELGLNILDGKIHPAEPVTVLDIDAVPMFDWGQIRRWGGTPENLSPDTVFLNRTPSGWEQYQAYIIAVLFFILIETGLVGGLLVNRRQRKKVEARLIESEARFRTLVEQAPDGIVLYDVDLRAVVDCNAAAERLFGCDREDLLSGDVTRFYHADQFHGQSVQQAMASSCERALAGESVLLERSIRNAQEKDLICEVRLAPLPAKDRRLIRASWIDVTDRKLAEAELIVAAATFDVVQDGIVITDANGVILRVNRAFTEITGYSAEEAIGKTPRILKSSHHDDAFYAEMWGTLRATGSWQGEIWDRRKNGEVYPKWLSIKSLKRGDGTITHYVAVHADITERKAAEESIKNLAFYDPLTQLPNRRLLIDRLHQTLAACTRSGREGALLFIDMDNFKAVNDTLGHDKGDQLLQEVARRLFACIREGDTAARFGGDEFVVMLEDLSEKPEEAAAQAETVGEKILVALGDKYLISGHEVHATPSIGITLFGDQRENIEELLKQADIAMYQAKGAGRNTLRFFDPDLQATVKARARLETDLRRGIGEEQLILFFQPQVDGDGRIVGAEAMVRWCHPDRGLVSPAEFIPLAEETGLILPLGQWVLETSCAQIVAWANRPETAHITLAVNVSARQFRQADFVAQVLATVNRTGADPRRLKLELTESLLVENVQDIVSKMHALKAHGVGFSLDDFGTGYSSLSYLKRLPLDQLKIDQSFVRDVLVDPNDATIARTVVALAQSLQLGVIAEGVETAEQRDFLAGAGCHAYQGYLFSRPLPLEGFNQFARQADSRVLPLIGSP